MIYAVEILDCKFVKIGYSSSDDSAGRIAALQTGNPFEIKKLFTIDGTIRQEQSLHALLNSSFGRLRLPMPPNEWYPGNHPFFKEFLKELQYGFDFGAAYLAKYDPCVKQPGFKGDGTTPNFKWPKLPAPKKR